LNRKKFFKVDIAKYTRSFMRCSAKSWWHSEIFLICLCIKI